MKVGRHNVGIRPRSMKAIDLAADSRAQLGVALEETIPPTVGDDTVLKRGAVEFSEFDKLGANNGASRSETNSSTKLDPLNNIEFNLRI